MLTALRSHQTHTLALPNGSAFRRWLLARRLAYLRVQSVTAITSMLLPSMAVYMPHAVGTFVGSQDGFSNALHAVCLLILHAFECAGTVMRWMLCTAEHTPATMAACRVR